MLLIARTALAASGLSASLALRDTSKVYWALTRGVPKQKNGVVKGALAKEGGHGPRGRDERMAMAEEGEEGAKFSLTEYAVMATAGTEFAWVAARPITGRTHQIRVHMAAFRHPCVGDRLYGADPVLATHLGLARQWLHAVRLAFAHPADGRRAEFTSTYPAALAPALDILRAES